MGISIIFVGARTYQLWKLGPWDLPTAGKSKASSPAEPAIQERPQVQLANTRNIIDKNLFDPERGATKTKAEAEQRDAAARQRIASMVLLGTAILGSSRYAIMQEPSNPAARTPATKTPPAGSGQMRLKQGDTVEGFRLSEVRDKSVVFTKGASKVELTIDYFRRVDQASPTTTAPAPIPPRPGLSPRVAPRVPSTGDTGQPQTQQNVPTAVDRARNALRERQLRTPQQPQVQPPQRNAPPNAEKAPAENQ